MIAGVRGRLITTSFAETTLAQLCGHDSPPARVLHDIEGWAARCENTFGPASSIRAIADGVVLPLVGILGFDLIRRVDAGTHVQLEIGRAGATLAPAVVIGWDQPLDVVWRTTVLHAINTDARWAFCFNGTTLRIVDAQRTWSRHVLEFDLAVAAHDADTLTLLWRVARAESLARRPPLLNAAVDLSARHGVRVCGALGSGVIEALELLVGAGGTRRTAPDVLLDQSLTVLYRVLFLLFAEARGLVPIWHPIYRDRYTIDSIVGSLLSGRRYRGVWAAITAISRLAHAGCSAGELKVTAFNGRLFAPARTGAIERVPIDDRVMADVVLAISTTPPARGEPRRRIVYQDLDVEELGAVYEHVLDYEPAAIGGRTALVPSRDLRKSTGTFYTPRSLTAHLVRTTLAPLLAERSSDQILQLRVLDPAMGSGAFLVAACIQLAEAAEDALVREGTWHPGDVTAADRITLRRLIAQRCLFGVDLNPTAVQVARLSLWLTTLAADKPLTFLDHRLVNGNSLVGATPDDVLRQPAGRVARKGARRHVSVPLFDSTNLEPVIRHAAHERIQIADQPDDSAAIVRGKEKTLAALHSPASALGRHARLLDLWCAAWFWPDGAVPDRGTFAALGDMLLERPTALPRRFATPLLSRALRISTEQRFLHWPLAFPEVFHGGEGNCDAGFDAILGNPPWDMVRGDSGDSDRRSTRRDEARHLTAFVREAGIYRVESRSHVNRYQLFVERALQLARCGGRIGFVLPAGTMSDSGCAPLRRFLFDRARVDSVTYLENRRGIFPIHRGLTFLLLTCSRGEPTNAINCRFGVSDPEQLDQPAPTVVMTRALLARLSGEDDLAIPEMQDQRDVRLLERISARFPMLSAADGWGVAFGRELNATDDRGLFVEAGPDDHGRQVLEGKAIEPFRVSTGHCRFRLRDDAHVKIPQRPRLAYRDVASATNRLTLIAAIIPATAATTHTLFCLKTPLAMEAQHVLCALLNSFVANYLVRSRVNTHVTVTLVSRLRVPRLDATSRIYRRLSSLAETLMHSPSGAESQPEYAELQAVVARAYELSGSEFSYVMSTFPLIPAEVKDYCANEFRRLSTT